MSTVSRCCLFTAALTLGALPVVQADDSTPRSRCQANGTIYKEGATLDIDGIKLVCTRRAEVSQDGAEGTGGGGDLVWQPASDNSKVSKR